MEKQPVHPTFLITRRCVTMNQVRGIFGLGMDDYIGKIAFPAVQVGSVCLLPSSQAFLHAPPVPASGLYVALCAWHAALKVEQHFWQRA